MSWGLTFALLCGVTACSADDSEQLSQAATGAASCVLFAGNPHCGMGAASVALGARGLTVTGMHTAEFDGVSIDLPDVTSFDPQGAFQTEASDVTLVERSINRGVSASTLTSVITPRGMWLSASFPGDGQGSSYRAVFYRMGEEVGAVAGIPSGMPVIPPFVLVPIVNRPASFSIRPSIAAGVLARARAWSKGFAAGASATVMLDGSQVSFDSLELVEEVPASGGDSYPSFDRIEYTYDSGALTLTGEELR